MYNVSYKKKQKKREKLNTNNNREQYFVLALYMPLALLRTRTPLHTCIIAFLFTVLCSSFLFFSVLCVNLLKVKYYTYQLGLMEFLVYFMPWKYAIQRKCSMLFKYSRQNRKMNVTRGHVLKNSVLLNFLPCR